MPDPKDEIEVTNPRFAGASFKDVARALLRPLKPVKSDEGNTEQGAKSEKGVA